MSDVWCSFRYRRIEDIYVQKVSQYNCREGKGVDEKVNTWRMRSINKLPSATRRSSA
jgi:hypothetical protein